MAIDADFVQMLACPACRGELVLQGDDRLHCGACHRTYPVRDDIPILLLDAATVEAPEATSDRPTPAS